MSHVPGMIDNGLHHEDGSHRWTGGDGTPEGDAAWRARVETHMAQHRAGLDRLQPSGVCGLPRQRKPTVGDRAA